jgi:rhodanese-related sulfurtransferase
MKALGQLAAIVALGFLAAGMTLLVKGPPVRVVQCDPALLQPDEICLQEVRERDPGGTLWVDARPRPDWVANGYPGSLLWNLDPREDLQAFEAEMAVRLIEGPVVVVYCGDENCGASRQVAKQIRELGFDAQVYVLYGGWRALREADLVKDSNPAL